MVLCPRIISIDMIEQTGRDEPRRQFVTVQLEHRYVSLIYVPLRPCRDEAAATPYLTTGMIVLGEP